MVLRLSTVFLLAFSGTFLSAQSPNWWRDAVFYEVFVRSFQDSDGDGIGDLQGLISKLDYLNDGVPGVGDDLEIDAIWLMPICESPSYHGYDVTDYRLIEPDYGTNADFKQLIDAAHARGIRVIVDLVLNHSSSSHPWFTSAKSSPGSPYRDWYHFHPSHPGYSGPWGQPVWHNTGSGDYFYGLFWSGMPDLDVTNLATRNELLDITRFWLDSMEVDGFRLDAIKHLAEQANPASSAFTDSNTDSTFAFLEVFRTTYKEGNPEAFSVGEVWTSTSEIVPYVSPTALDLCFDFDLASSIRNSVNAGNEEAARDQITELNRTYEDFSWASFLSNHDQDRIMSQFGGSESKAKLAAALLLTLPGTPFIYYGEEIGSQGTGDHLNIRRPFPWEGIAGAGFTTGSPWQAFPSDYLSRNVADQQANPSSLWSTYQEFLRLRKKAPELSNGSFFLLNDGSNSLYSFLRASDDGFSVVVANLSNSAVSSTGISLPASTLEPGIYNIEDQSTGASVVVLPVYEGGGFSDWNPVSSFPARSVSVFRIDGAPSSPPPGLMNGLSWVPLNPRANETVEIRINGATQPPTLHWGVTEGGFIWRNPIPAYRPAGSVLWGGFGPAVQTPFIDLGGGSYSLTLGPFEDPTQIVEEINFVIAYPSGPWDNNGLADYHIEITPNACEVPVAIQSNVLADARVFLSWAKVPAATGYQIQGRKVGGGVRNIVLGDVAGYYSPPLQDGNSYQWRIRALCPDTVSTYSAAQDFFIPLLFAENSEDQAARLPEASFEYYPNPASEAVYVRTLAEETIELIDLKGQQVQLIQLKAGETAVLQVADLPRGIYLLRGREGYATELILQ